MEYLLTNYHPYINFNFNFNFLTFLSVNYSETSALAQAISDSIDEIFVKNEIKFDIHVQATENYFRDLVDEISVRNNGKYAYKLHTHSNIPIIGNSSVILTDNMRLFYSIIEIDDYGRIKNNNKINYPTILIYCHNVTNNTPLPPNEAYSRSEMIFKRELKKYFIVSNSNGFSLMSHFIVKSERDHKLQLGSVDTFDKKLFKWSENFDKLKYKSLNFKNFYLVISLMNRTKQEFNIDKLHNAPTGIIVELIKIFGKRGNFETSFGVENQQQHSMIRHQMHLTTSLRFSEYQIDDFITTTFKEEEFKLIITPAESYTSYEKLIMPFDMTTWIFLLLTFLVAFIIILIVNLFPKKFQILIYGENVQMPGYNIISIFFGIGQTQLPSSNFSRFILLLFILFCLIIRTAYQGVLYELITGDVRRQLPKTIVQLFDQNYTFCGANTFSVKNYIHGLMKHHLDLIANETGKTYNFHSIDDEKYGEFYLDNYKNASAKLVFLADEYYLNEFNKLCNCNNLVLDQTLFKYQAGLSINWQHFLTDLFEDTLQRIVPFGIPQHLAEFHKWSCYHQWGISDDGDGPQILTVESLSFGFVLWLSACGISIMGFVWELLYEKLKRIFRNFIGLILFLMLLKHRLRSCIYL